MEKVETVLEIYLAPSGQWSGKLLSGGEEVGRIAGCSSAEEVEETAGEQGLTFDLIRVSE